MGRGSVTRNERRAGDTGLWARVKGHFTESFSGELLSPQRAEDAEKRDEWRDKRRRNAYRYILFVIAAVLIPVIVHNYYVGQTMLAAGILTMFVVVIGNIVLLSAGREAVASPHVVLLFSICLVTFACYLGQNFALFLLFPLLVALPVLLRMRWALILGVVSGLAVAPMIIVRFEPMAAFVMALSLALTWLVAAWLVFAVTEQARRLRGMAITDPLTGAYNRRYLELRAGKSLENWKRYERAETLLIIDIDHFKRINDRFGHAIGDQALKGLVQLIEERVRSVDTLCRFGGEEFVLLLSEADSAQAEKVAHKLRAVVEGACLVPEGNMTISIGIAHVALAQDLEHWFKLADGALYLAKSNGRNRVEVATAGPLKVVPIAKTVPVWR